MSSPIVTGVQAPLLGEPRLPGLIRGISLEIQRAHVIEHQAGLAQRACAAQAAAILRQRTPSQVTSTPPDSYTNNDIQVYGPLP